MLFDLNCSDSVVAEALNSIFDVFDEPVTNALVRDYDYRVWR